MATSQETDGASGSGITAAQLETLMATMRQGIKDELAMMKRELSAESEESDEKLVKKLSWKRRRRLRRKVTRNSGSTTRRSSSSSLTFAWHFRKHPPL